MNRGIDPATHRPLNEVAHSAQNQEAASAAAAGAATSGGPPTTISFASSAKQLEHQHQHHHQQHHQQETSSSNGSVLKGSSSMVLERCPDLNLELTISPPRQHEADDIDQKFKNSTERSLCFVCSLGLQNKKDCTCGNNTATAAYDFLGLKADVWDYTGLQMK